MASNDYYELYRRSRLVSHLDTTPSSANHGLTRSTPRSIGLTLVDTLDDMVHEQRIEPQLAMKVVARFDRAMAEVLAEKVKARLTFKVRNVFACFGPRIRNRREDAYQTEFKGHLDTYRFCDEVWTFLIKDVNFKLDNGNTVQSDGVKIVSCNAKKPGET